MALQGRCLCEGVQFEITDEPSIMGTCHCTRCQRQSGGGGSVAIVVDESGFSVTQGEDMVKEFSQEGFTSRFFCSNCGSFLYGKGPEMMYVAAGSLREDPGLRPQFHMMVAHKAAWDEIHDALPQFPDYPQLG